MRGGTPGCPTALAVDARKARDTIENFILRWYLAKDEWASVQLGQMAFALLNTTLWSRTIIPQMHIDSGERSIFFCHMNVECNVPANVTIVHGEYILD